MTEKDPERLGQKQGGRRQGNYRDPENRTAREGDRKKWAGASQKGDRDSEGCRPKEAKGTKRADQGHLLNMATMCHAECSALPVAFNPNNPRRWGC